MYEILRKFKEFRKKDNNMQKSQVRNLHELITNAHNIKEPEQIFSERQQRNVLISLSKDFTSNVYRDL